jgi:hypothetical protein
MPALILGDDLKTSFFENSQFLLVRLNFEKLLLKRNRASNVTKLVLDGAVLNSEVYEEEGEGEGRGRGGGLSAYMYGLY